MDYNNNMSDDINHEIKEVTPLSFREKIKKSYNDLKELFHDVLIEGTQKIEWITASELFQHVKNFTVVAVISIICLFIVDNMIIYGLKWLFVLPLWQIMILFAGCFVGLFFINY